MVSENSMSAQHYLIRRLAVRSVLLAACYLIATVTQVNHLIYTLTKANYRFYQLVFYLSMFFLSLIVAPLRRSWARRGFTLSLGPVIGYASGLTAFLLLPLGRGSGLGRILTTKDISLVFFLSPCITFSWLVGFYFALLIVFFQTKRVGAPQ